MKYIRVNRRRPCPVCGKTDWCGVSADGLVVLCMRINSGRQAKNGAWIHSFGEDRPNPPRRPVPQSKILSVAGTREPEYLDRVYSAFLDRLVLAKDHAADLRTRGLNESLRIRGGYKSMPTPLFASKICEQLIRAGTDLRGVPGFYLRAGRWQFVDYRHASGYLIPIRNWRQQIVALQLRRDDARKPKYLMISSAWHPGGAGCGTPPHFATLGAIGGPQSARTVIITEGALKANIIAEYTRTRAIGLVGVGTFRESFADTLLGVFPSLESAEIAFDMDSQTNKAVRAQRDRLVKLLEKINIKISILCWNPLFKGFDDYLVAASQTKNLKAA